MASDGQSAVSAGPCETERQAADRVRHSYDMEPGTGAWAAASHRLLCEALTDPASNSVPTTT
jgi:hypothetical protein